LFTETFNAEFPQIAATGGVMFARGQATAINTGADADAQIRPVSFWDDGSVRFAQLDTVGATTVKTASIYSGADVVVATNVPAVTAPSLTITLSNVVTVQGAAVLTNEVLNSFTLRETVPGRVMTLTRFAATSSLPELRFLVDVYAYKNGAKRVEVRAIVGKLLTVGRGLQYDITLATPLTTITRSEIMHHRMSRYYTLWDTVRGSAWLTYNRAQWEAGEIFPRIMPGISAASIASLAHRNPTDGESPPNILGQWPTGYSSPGDTQSSNFGMIHYPGAAWLSSGSRDAYWSVLGFERTYGRYPYTYITDTHQAPKLLDFPNYGLPSGNFHTYGVGAATNRFASADVPLSPWTAPGSPLMQWDRDSHHIQPGLAHAMTCSRHLQDQMCEDFALGVFSDLAQGERNFGDGRVGRTTRGEAWHMGFMSRVAALLPPTHYYQPEVVRVFTNNIEYFHARWQAPANINNLNVVTRTSTYAPNTDGKHDTATFQLFYLAWAFGHAARLRVLPAATQAKLTALAVEAGKFAPNWWDVSGRHVNTYTLELGTGSDAWPPPVWHPNWLAVFNATAAKQPSTVVVSAPYNRNPVAQLDYAPPPPWTASTPPWGNTTISDPVSIGQSYLGVAWPALVEAERQGNALATSMLDWLVGYGIDMGQRRRFFIRRI
jgi:hypothetical protein